MPRVYNFGAGPAALPLEVLEQIRDEIFEWRNTGVSMLELNHRGDQFKQLIAKIEKDCRELLAIPQNYKVLFLAGGARVQFSMIPMNILGESKTADYVDTGFWGQTALKEAQHYCEVNVAASSQEFNYTKIPELAEWKLNPQSAYLHYTANETINGVEFHTIPDVKNIPLVSDMTSNLFTKPIDVSRFGIIYAGAQKNAGIGGLTILIIREDLLDKATLTTPLAFNYKLQAENNSILITPPTFAWYVAGLIFTWLKQQGGVAAMGASNQRKAQKIYRIIDQHKGFYLNNIDPSCRSRVNIPFTLADKKCEELFLNQAEAAGLANLKGHAVSGGVRATLYNAISEPTVHALANFMEDFVKRHG